MNDHLFDFERGPIPPITRSESVAILRLASAETWIEVLRVFVPGIPRPGGSKTAKLVCRKGGAPVMVGGRPLITTREAGKHTPAWKDTVATFARAAWGARDPLRCELAVGFTFTMPRPKSHFRASGALKPSAAGYHSSKPDLLKLMRSTEDALTGIVWHDDSLTVRFSPEPEKRYGLQPGVEIVVSVKGGTPC